MTDQNQTKPAAWAVYVNGKLRWLQVNDIDTVRQRAEDYAAEVRRDHAAAVPGLHTEVVGLVRQDRA